MEEILVYRYERKYIISYDEYLDLSRKLSLLLKPDDHNSKNGYIIRSLYFDSLNNIDLLTKLSGEEKRKKIRLRVYDSDYSKCKLEMKKKIGDNQHKISLWISKEDATELIKGNYNILLKYSNNKNAIDFYNIMLSGLYKPVSMIEYNRLAYTYPEFNTRITFDMKIRHSECNFDLFSNNINYSMDFYNNVILEVKYNKKLMGFISKILANYNLTNVAVSKYLMGRNQAIDVIF